MAMFTTSAPPAVGQPAPEFLLPSHGGSTVGLRDFRGSWTVLYFYPKDNTHICTLEARSFERDLERYRRCNAVVLGVSLDSPTRHHDFCAKQGLTFTLLSDTERKVTAQYGSLNSIFGFTVVARNTFLIDPVGNIAAVWVRVRVARHSEEILAAIAKLSQGLK